MRKLGVLLSGAAVIAMVGWNTVPAQAGDGHRGHGARHWKGGDHSARHWKGDNWKGRYARGGRNWDRGQSWRGGYRRDNGAGIALGLIGGALAGAAIASAAQPYYYSYSYPAYGYAYPGYGYYYSPY
jgi:hypothetical protein